MCPAPVTLAAALHSMLPPSRLPFLFGCGADLGFGGTLLAPSNCYWKHLLVDLDITEAMMLQQSNALHTLLLVCLLCCSAACPEAMLQ